MYDLIGDIHGHASELVKLLAALGYSQHPRRQAIFLGDFIDRGRQIRETLEIVRPMIDSNSAIAFATGEFSSRCCVRLMHALAPQPLKA